MSITAGWLKGDVRILDGATATELQRRGLEVKAPAWTNAALLDEDGRAALLGIHRDYAAAGADILTANTFRLNRRSLRAAGLERRAQELRDAAVALARRANPAGLVAGSLAPVEDCYAPGLVPGDSVLREEHGDSVAGLLEAGADLVLAETMNCAREAAACAEACRALGAPFLVSFACTDGGRLLSGEALSEGLAALAPYEPLGVLVNCTGFSGTRKALQSVMPWGPEAGGLLAGAYANIEERAPELKGRHVNRYLSPKSSPVEFAALTRNLVRDFGLKLVGGCCGSTPEHIRQLASVLKPHQEAAR